MKRLQNVKPAPRDCMQLRKEAQVAIHVRLDTLRTHKEQNASVSTASCSFQPLKKGATSKALLRINLCTSPENFFLINTLY